MEEYYFDLAIKHYDRSFIKMKSDTSVRERYFKCWVNDHCNLLMDYDINVENFINNLIINKKQITWKKDSSKSTQSSKITMLRL